MKETVRTIGSWIRKHSSWLKVIFLFSVLLFVVNQMTSILQGMTWEDLKAVLSSQRKQTLLLMTAIGLTAVLPMLVYDWVTVSILEENGKPRLSRKTLFTSAWTTNTLNNLAGFGGVIGATLRARFYGQEAETKKVVTTVSKVAIFMLSGLSLLCAVTFVDIFFIRRGNPYGSYWVWLLGGSLYAPGLFLFTRLRRQRLFADFPLKRVLTLFLGSFGQWCGALGTFLLIGQLLEVPVDVWQVYPLFVAATFIGMISMVPGGMGTFDVLMIVGLGQVGLPKEIAVAWLLYYRIFYYVVPFLTGLFSFIHQTSTKINQFFDDLPKVFTQKTAHFILVCMVYFAGITMALLSTIPNLSNLSQLVSRLLPYSFNFLDQTLNMMVGFLLIGLARGVANRVKKAYLPTIIVLAFCIVNTVARTVSWSLIVFYLFLIVCIYWSRKEFYRKQLVFSWESLTFDGLLYGALFLLYSVVGFYSTDRLEHGEVPANFLLFPSEAVWIQGLAGLVLAAITIFLLYHYLASSDRAGLYFDKKRINQLLERYGGTTYSHLVFLKDKRHYYYREDNLDKVMFTFELQGSKLFVLGNPVGEPDCLKKATTAFIRYGDRLGYQLVFYGVTDDYTLLLHDLGFDFMKLGEEGQLRLRTAEERQTISANRTETKRLESLGYHFQWYEPPLSNELFVELEKISDNWVKAHGERYFSNGRFKREYLNQAPVGVVYSEQREAVGFISLKPIQGYQEMGYDLLRFKKSAPADLGAFMVTHAIDSCQAKGGKLFDLGLAPLANVGNAETSFMKERIVNVFYTYSSSVVSFQDVRSFKAEFATDWKPRYLSYQKSNEFFLMMQLYLLIDRGKRRRPRPMEGVMIE
ncbi:bifunctional lysylphosphatidylglycerol flippase/synthetase MprF [Vagococcus sp. BWB3-3]|uniref:Phosphatidylglycerol lysyltransferase n=1 Tax=Vagococcus allomyrinae TaxID=2794353 RepID=A0A940P2M1_9ENTE|nr:bifunctional lysylphosphatidylglycerol flippase/synthetase MprF [Vagococcus allomyrinae]MBP1039905.1 bifunctional lysylphosphatidylglycerol flippase/synthetase MprF [Vagococcus allomyrinae]